MKPVFQTRFGFPHGNCFNACLASVLEMPLEAIPDGLGTTGDWQAPVRDFLRPLGLTIVSFAMDVDANWLCGDVWHLIAGRSPRGDFDHCCVGQGGRIVHDPYPGGNGVLLGRERTIDLFVTLDPAVRLHTSSHQNATRGQDWVAGT